MTFGKSSSRLPILLQLGLRRVSGCRSRLRVKRLDFQRRGRIQSPLGSSPTTRFNWCSIASPEQDPITYLVFERARPPCSVGRWERFVLRDSPRMCCSSRPARIAPFRFMLWAWPRHRRRVLSHSCGDCGASGILYYQDELISLRERLPRFSFITTLSQPSAAWRGTAGRVTRCSSRRTSQVLRTLKRSSLWQRRDDRTSATSFGGRDSVRFTLQQYDDIRKA